MFNKKMKLLALLSATMMMAAGCSSAASSTASTGGNAGTATFEPGGKLTMASVYYTAEVPDRPDTLEKIKELTGYELDITWIPSIGYADKINTMMASDALPMITAVTDNKGANFITACRAGSFWQLDEYLPQFENLVVGENRDANVYNNTRIDGNLYGIYRHRNIVRQGIIYREDWLQDAGLEEPNSPNEMMEVIRTFADKYAEYGLVMGGKDSIAEAIQYFAIWNGAPNNWGIDETDGKMKPDFMFPEYREALGWMRDMYAEGLINQNFPELSSEDAKKLLNTEQAGFICIYTDDLANRFLDLATKNPDAKLTLSLNQETNDGVKRCIATTGYNGVLAMAKSAVKDEATLLKCLDYINKTAMLEMRDIARVGLEGPDHTVVDGKIDTSDTAKLENFNRGGNQFGQIVCFYNNINSKPVIEPPVNALINEEQGGKHNADAVFDISNAYLSQTWTEMSADLNPIKIDAVTQYVIGNIDDAGYDAAIKAWLDQGGQKVIDEFTEAYKAVNG